VSLVGTRPSEIRAEFLDGFAHALHGVLLWATAIAVLAFAISWLLREIPLRDTTPGAEQPGPTAAVAPAA